MHTEGAGVDKVAIVKESLFNFITSHVPNADLSAIDDIILSYVYSAIEVAPADFFAHVNDFVDMMSAYVPDFSKIETDDVYVWMINVVSSLADKPVNGATGEKSLEDKLDGVFSIVNLVQDRPKKISRSNSSSSESSESSQSGSVVVVESQELAEQCRLLQEMFPNTSAIEIKHCVSIANGDMERATGTLMHRRESGEALAAAPLTTSATKTPVCDETTMKTRIIDRYSYVDKEAETKEHKPVTPKNEPKKMVRYRDNKIVSLKGERYTEVPKCDEENVKKSNKKHHP